MDKRKLQLAITLTDENEPSERSFLEKVEKSSRHFMVLRKPVWEVTRVKTYLKAIPKRFYGNIILYRNWELLHDFPCHGVHFPSDQMKEATTARERFPDIWISTSVHTAEEVERANQLPFTAILASPVFPPCSKPSTRPPLGLEGLREIAERSLHPVIALGGITEENYRQCYDCQTVGTAAIGSIWSTANPAQFIIGEIS